MTAPCRVEIDAWRLAGAAVFRPTPAVLAKRLPSHCPIHRIVPDTATGFRIPKERPGDGLDLEAGTRACSPSSSSGGSGDWDSRATPTWGRARMTATPHDLESEACRPTRQRLHTWAGGRQQTKREGLRGLRAHGSRRQGLCGGFKAAPEHWRAIRSRTVRVEVCALTMWPSAGGGGLTKRACAVTR